MTTNPREIVVPKEKAVFWLDGNGRWHNIHGPFEHPKIIDFFHSSIRKDQGGYYLWQTTDTYTEKVYFRYEDTALFVFDVLVGEAITLVLNTKQKVPLDPERLFVDQDRLYMDTGQDCLKFTERALHKIADLIEDDGGQYYLRLGAQRFRMRPLAEARACAKPG